MNNIAPVSNSELVAPLTSAPAHGASPDSKAGATTVQPADAAARQNSSDARDTMRQSEAIEKLRAQLSANARTRLQIERDEESTGRFIYKLMNPDTGEVLRRWPPEKFGDLVDLLKGEGNAIINERA